MRGVCAVGAVSATVVVVGILGPASPAFASNYGIELNGTYRAISNGDWAQSSEGPFGAGGARVYRDQPTKVENWTVSSSCVSPIECTGEVKSDAGWTAALKFTGDVWMIDRDIPNWAPCPDGTAAPGHQNFGVWGWDEATSQRSAKIRDLLQGFERTIAPSGACGVNKPLVIELPVRLEKTS
jgi:hypothetical protein